MDKNARRAYVLIEDPGFTDPVQRRQYIDQVLNWTNYVIDTSFVLAEALVEMSLAELRGLPDVAEPVSTFGPGAFNVPNEQREILDSKRVEALIKFVDREIVVDPQVDQFM
ncbi:MAG TPA: hypothetical protein VGE21_06620 [Flavobacteriales bacterium]